MNILAIECTHAALSVAVKKSGTIVEVATPDWQKAAEKLVPLIGQVMEESDLDRHELDCMAISSGPGSFTSLRIGMSVAKGIAYALGIPLLAVPTMPAMAASLSSSAMVMAVIPARKGEYYYALYRPEDLASGVWHDEAGRGSADDVAAAATVAAQSGETVVVGRKLHELIPALASSGALYADANSFTARSLFPAAERLFAGSDAADLDQVTPDYRYMFVPNGGKV